MRRKLPLPRGWNRRVKSSILQVLSLAWYISVLVRGSNRSGGERFRKTRGSSSRAIRVRILGASQGAFASTFGLPRRCVRLRQFAFAYRRNTLGIRWMCVQSQGLGSIRA